MRSNGSLFLDASSIVASMSNGRHCRSIVVRGRRVDLSIVVRGMAVDRLDTSYYGTTSSMSILVQYCT